jgi:hypothetical protein
MSTFLYLPLEKFHKPVNRWSKKKGARQKKIPENSGIFFCLAPKGANRFCDGWLASSGLPPEQKRLATQYARKISAKN